MQNIWVWLVVAIIVMGGGYWLWQSQQAPVAPVDTGASTQVQGTTDTSGTPAGTSGSTSAPMTATVTYSGTSFTPSTVTIAKGGTVTFVDSSGRGFWVASAPHPTHEGYSGTTRTQHCPDTSGTAFDQCAPGTSYSFTFQKTGSWGYHDHLNTSAFGTVVVQ